MSSEATLAKTVYHKGRKYRGGMTAEEIGPVAAEFGDHVWVGGKAPAKQSIPDQGSPDGGVHAATPPVPTKSGLPGPDTSADIAEATRTEAAPSRVAAGEPAPEPGPEPDAAPRKTTGTGRRGGTGSGS